MHFIYPLFLGALATIAIPILIHLFYFRRYKKVYFTNVAFLKEVKEESSVRSRLKNLLILLCRIFAVIFLVLAFTQPFVTSSEDIKAGKKAVSIFIDNSYSMASLGRSTNLLELAKRHAETIVNSYDLNDDIQIITHDLKAKHQRLLKKEQAISEIYEVEMSAAANRFSDIFRRQNFALDQSDADYHIIYWISDFQKSISDFNFEIDSSLEVNLLPLYPVIEKNLSIDSAWFEAPVNMVNKNNQLFVQIKNWGKTDAENAKISMEKDGEVQGIGTTFIPAGQTVVDTINILSFKPGWERIVLTVSDYPVQFDDELFVSYPVSQEINIQVIHEGSPNKYLDAALHSETYFHKTSTPVTQLDYSSLSEQQLLVIDGLNNISGGLGTALESYISEGGNVLIFPNREANLESYNAFFNLINAGRMGNKDARENEVISYNANEFVFNDVFELQRAAVRLPKTLEQYQISLGRARAETLLTYRDGTPFVLKFPYHNGYAYFCTAPLDIEVNNLVTQAEVFVPMIYKMAISRAKSWQLAYTIGKNDLVEVDNIKNSQDEVYTMKGPSEFIPSQTNSGNKVILRLFDQIISPGFYEVTKDDASLAVVAYNNNRLESDLSFYSESELEQFFGEKVNYLSTEKQTQLAQLIKEKNQGTLLWRYCLIMTLIFLALETLIIRFWSNT